MISSDIIKKYNVPNDEQVRLAISRRQEEIMYYWKSIKDLDEEEEDFLNSFYDTLERASFMFTKEFNDILKGNVRADCSEDHERKGMSRKDVPYDAMGDYTGFKFIEDE